MLSAAHRVEVCKVSSGKAMRRKFSQLNIILSGHRFQALPLLSDKYTSRCSTFAFMLTHRGDLKWTQTPISRLPIAPTSTFSTRMDDCIEDEIELDFPIRPHHRFIIDLLLSCTFRAPKPVTKVRIHRDRNMYAVCPRCDNSMEYEYQLYCNCCGQHLE